MTPLVWKVNTLLLIIVVYNLYLCLLSVAAIWSWLFAGLKIEYVILLMVGDLAPPIIAFYTYATSSRSIRRHLLEHRISSSKAEDLFSDCVKVLRVSRPVELFVTDSDSSDAYTFGGGNSSVLVLTRGLVELLTPDELRGVIGHELAHVINGDVGMMTWTNSLVRVYGKFLPLYLLVTSLNVLLDLATGFGNPLLVAVHASVTIVFIFILPTLLIDSLSRNREYAADLVGLSLSQKFSDALRELAINFNQSTRNERLSLLPCKSKKYFLDAFETHPTLRDRLRTLHTREAPAGFRYTDALTVGAVVAASSVILIEVILSSAIYLLAFIPNILPIAQQGAVRIALTVLLEKYFENLVYFVELVVPLVLLYVVSTSHKEQAVKYETTLLDGLAKCVGLFLLPLYFLLPEQGVATGGPFPIPAVVWPTGSAGFSVLVLAAITYFVVLCCICLGESLASIMPTRLSRRKPFPGSQR